MTIRDFGQRVRLATNVIRGRCQFRPPDPPLTADQWRFAGLIIAGVVAGWEPTENALPVLHMRGIPWSLDELMTIVNDLSPAARLEALALARKVAESALVQGTADSDGAPKGLQSMQPEGR